MTEHVKTYKVYTWRLANRLNDMGFRPVGKRLNFKDPTQEVILFADTPEFREALNKLITPKETTQE